MVKTFKSSIINILISNKFNSFIEYIFNQFLGLEDCVLQILQSSLNFHKKTSQFEYSI